MNARRQGAGLALFGGTPNGLSIPPGEYGRKVKKLKGIDRGPAQAVEHVV